MAANDIMPWQAPSGAEERLSHPVAATQAFLVGEPVVLSNGALIECVDDPANVDGISAQGAEERAGIGLSVASLPVGSSITIYGVNDTQVFTCSNFATDGAGTSAAPTQANAIDELAGLTLDASTIPVWYVDTGTANQLVRIVDVLDARRNSIQNPQIVTTAGVTVLFKFI